MSPVTGVLIFEGGQEAVAASSGAVRQAPAPDAAALLSRCRFWSTLDTVGKFLGRPGVDLVVVATDRPDLAREAAAAGARVHLTDAGFHFGRALAGLVAEHRLDRVIYLGGGSAPLLEPAEIDLLLGRISSGDRLFVANNAQSPDLVGLASTEAVACLAGQSTDNATLFALSDAGYERVLLPETATVGFDLDTPSDMLFLAYEAARRARAAGGAAGSGGLGPRLAAGLPTLDLDVTILERAVSVLARPDYPAVSLVGRVSGTTMSYLNANLLVRLRVFSEERGMKALGLIEEGRVRSLLAAIARDHGLDYLVRELAALSDVVFWDTRVLLAALGRWPGESDRFEADLGRWKQVEDPDLARLCRLAGEAPCPFVLGGHSVVSGGLRLLADAARDFPKAGYTAL